MKTGKFSFITTPAVLSCLMFKWLAVAVFAVGLVWGFAHILPYKTPNGLVYEMPVECDGDLTEATASTFIYNMPASTLAKWNAYLKIAPEGWRLYGTTVSLPGLQPFIVIDESLEQKQYDKTLHHELCHIVSGAWHV